LRILVASNFFGVHAFHLSEIKITRMTKLLLCFSLLFLQLTTFAQNGIIDGPLHSQLTDPARQNDYFRVRILLADQVDNFALSAKLDAEQANRDTRVRRVVKALADKAAATQGPLLEQINSLAQMHPEKIKFYQPYWIANLVVIDAQAAIILYLAQSVPGIALIDPDLDLEFVTDPITVDPVNASPNAINGSEIGLRVIKSDSLWKRGYTGRGRLGMIIDSGASGLHPALVESWRGNFAPLNESWLGPGTLPNECGGNHGSHVMGIILGLQRNTNDTVGSAFNAHWIAASGIGCSGGPSATAAFQWALNPDNDTTTSDDVPDVVNNSWGGSGGTSQCNGSYVPIFNALEAAGVAVVFSAGNSGPNVSTITSPKNINTNEVNVFCVGNINGNSAALPIANSSSRGPSVCVSPEAPLLIKPEVVAPGTSVRSSVGANGYSNFTGTSMAAPHVAGGILLLKEAFPNVPGSTIMRAIYNTAIDMGAVGEDNTYGNGRVDLNAAFNFLALTFTPAVPVGGAYNIKAEGISGINSIVCADSVRPIIAIRNRGDSAITQITIDVTINNVAVLRLPWTGSLASTALLNLTLPSLFVPAMSSNNSINVRLSLDTSLVELDTFDNRIQTTFQLRTAVAAPFREEFEFPNLSSSPFFVLNADNGIGWGINSSNGMPNSIRSAMMNCHAYNSRGQFDYMETPRISLPDTGQALLRFYLAYAENPGNKDSLFIDISTDCGNTFGTRIYANGGAGMSTATPRNTPFIPVSAADWQRIELPLNAFVNQNDIIIRFGTKNDFGNNIYLDRIVVTTNSNRPIADFSNSLATGCAPLDVFTTTQSLFATSQQWRFNGTNGNTLPLDTTNFQSGNQNLSLIATNSHGSDTLSYTVVVPNNPVVNFNIINNTVRQNQNILLVNISQFASNFLWNFGDGTSSTAFGPAKSYADTGWYDISLTGTHNGCAVTLTIPNAIYVIDLFTSTETLERVKWKIYPNPAKDVLFIEADAAIKGGIRILDLLGREHISITGTSESRLEIPLNQLGKGMYLVQLKTDQGVLQQKLIKE